MNHTRHTRHTRQIATYATYAALHTRHSRHNLIGCRLPCMAAAARMESDRETQPPRTPMGPSGDLSGLTTYFAAR